MAATLRPLVKDAPAFYGKLRLGSFFQLDSVVNLQELRVPPGNRLEPLSGDRMGQFSIRINDQYRICFSCSDDAPSDVEIVDYH